MLIKTESGEAFEFVNASFKVDSGTLVVYNEVGKTIAMFRHWEYITV